MKKFDILRYLRRFFALVLAVTMAGTVVVYWYCKNNQTYTASVNIKYLHDGIKDGFAPDGTAMNVDEIYSSKVISQAMESLGLQSGINLVRSHCTVEELIPDDQKALQEALIDKGEESTYFPDEYKVTLVVDGSLGASYARRVLDAIVSSYSTIYTEEYVELPLTMNPSSGLLNSGYDYYECVDALSADTTEVLNYLEDKKTNYPNFRSSVTGYSYEDLYDIYKMLYDYEIPSLYANVMTGPQVRNADKLCRNLTQSIESSVQNEQVYQEREAYLSGLIQNYSEKNRDLINYHYHNDANDSGTDYILKNVEAYDNNQSKQITYDSLILEYVEIDKTLRSSAIRRAYTQQLLDTFQAAGGVGGDEASHAAIESEINKYEQTGEALVRSRRIQDVDCRRAALRLGYGIFKKVAIANLLFPTYDSIFSGVSVHTPGNVIVLGIIVYSVYMYADFSGGIDIVEGVSELFGIQMAQNFRQPYFSVSLSDFWRRWHISLGAWMRDYVFYPFALSRPVSRLSKAAKGRFGAAFARALPAALTDILLVGGVMLFYLAADLPDTAMSTICAGVMGVVGLMMVHQTAKPYNKLRIAMICVLTLGFAGSFLFLKALFNLVTLDFLSALVLAVFALLAWPVMNVMYKLLDKLSAFVQRRKETRLSLIHI